jgi:hypothetical protein
MATRYGLLPSEILKRSDTLDLFVMDLAMSWQRDKDEESRAKAEGRPKQSNQIPVSKLQDMIDKVKKQNAIKTD